MRESCFLRRVGEEVFQGYISVEGPQILRLGTLSHAVLGQNPFVSEARQS